MPLPFSNSYLHKKDAVLASKIELEVEKKGKIAYRTDAMIAAIQLTTTQKLHF